MKEADLSRMMRANNLRIVETATVPGVPDLAPRRRERHDRASGGVSPRDRPSVAARATRQLGQDPGRRGGKLGATFLGLLPELSSIDRPRRRDRPKRRGRPPHDAVDAGPTELVVHMHPSSGVSEAARSIRTNLMFMNPDRPCRRLLVTSAAPSEGKTTVACSIAIAMAQGGQRVCIVDADLRRPRLHRIFDRAGEAGLTSALVGEATLDDVAKPTIVPNLWSVPAGPLPPNPADLLQSDRFRKFVKELGDRFDRVIIDSPPLVAVTDSAIISTLVDGTVFVVRAFQTGKHVSAQGLRVLRDVEAPIVGAVLNAVNLRRHEYNYYHYYYYKREGYGSSAPDTEQASASAAPPN